MPIKPNQDTLCIEKNAIVNVLGYTGDVYDGKEPFEIILSKLEEARGTDRAQGLEPLYYMIDKIFYSGLNDTKSVFTENLTTIYVYYEESSDFDAIAAKMKHNSKYRATCSVDYYLEEKIWFPYSIKIQENENFHTIIGKILNLNLGLKTRKFYMAMIPTSFEEVDLAKAEIKDGYLVLTIHGKDNLIIEEYENELLDVYDMIREGGLID